MAVTHEICHDNSDELKCENGKVVAVQNAWYGRIGGRKGSCETEEDSVPCGIDVTNSIQLELCEGSRGCQVIAKDEFFPNTTNCLSSVKKHLTVKYRCIPYSKLTFNNKLRIGGTIRGGSRRVVNSLQKSIFIVFDFI